MVQSKDFYSYCHQILESKENIDIVIGDVVSVDPLKDEVQVGISDQPAIYAKHVFDSRLPDMRDLRKSVKLVQHFKGVRIQTDKPVFDPHSFVMMDYRYKDGDGCSFMYVLPSSKNEALIEFTYFDREVVEEVVYDEFIERYIQEELKISNFQVLASEMGQIPMSSYPFHTHNTPMISKIGTAGGWVKPSSGYSFRNAQKNSVAIVENIIAGRSYLDGIHSSRHRWYDKIMLRVLRERNDLGEELFFGLYSKRSIQRTFRFLDEESSLFDDLAIIAAFPPGPFIRAVFSS